MNQSSEFSRREFLQHSALAAAVGATVPFSSWADPAPGTEGEDAAASNDLKDLPQLRVLLHAPDGTPLPIGRVKTLHARDMANDPLPQPIATAEGRARIGLPKEPIQLSCLLEVPGFGEVYCYADNEGKGYTKPGTVEFVVEASLTRLRRVREFFERSRGRNPARTEGLPPSVSPAAHKLPVAYQRLAEGLHAGEKVALEAAQARIARFVQPRKNFLFGAPVAGRQFGAVFEKQFLEAFNLAVCTWYSWKNEQPVEQRIDYARMDESIQWCLDRKLTPKSFGYVYLTNGATPEWFRAWPWEKVLSEYKRIVAMTTRRYGNKLPFVEVINEAHDKANLFRFSHAQILELAKAACQAARDGSPTVMRQINNCCLWAEYAKHANADGVRRWTPFRFLSDCVKAGVEFERIGLQLYYPSQDIFEIDRMLDRFKAFKKPIHISEISCNSAPGLDPASMRPKSLVPGWHGPWSETMQADWAEAIYTLCYSKEEFEAVSWWDVADYGGHFWPHGGLWRKDLSPKESFLRLLALQKKWGLKT